MALSFLEILFFLVVILIPIVILATLVVVGRKYFKRKNEEVSSEPGSQL